MGRLSRTDQGILQGLIDGVDESMKLILSDDNPETGKTEKSSPFFAQLNLRVMNDYSLSIANGAIMKARKKPKQMYFSRGDIRVGNYKRGCSETTPFFPVFPCDKNMFVFRRNIWQKVNEALYNAVKDLRNRRNVSLGTPEKLRPYIYFSRGELGDYCNSSKISPLNMNYWADMLQRVSKLFIRDEIIDSGIHFAHEHTKRFLVNSEGTKIIDSGVVATLQMSASLLSDENLVLTNDKVWHSITPDKFPGENELMAKAENLIRELHEIKAAPQELADTYPIIVDGENHGVIWHEAAGHSGEGHRQEEKDNDDGWEDFSDFLNSSLVFKDKIGRPVAPDFITVYDDPTLRNGFGSYKFDEEGTRAQKVVFIENGILRNLFHSRESAGWMGKTLNKKMISNGHCRGGLLENPVPRMSNLIVRSTNEHAMDELKEMLFTECKKRNKKYGLLLRGIISGLSDLEGTYFKTFPKHIFRLYPDGREERVRGLYLGSTPYQMLENIVATTSDYQVCNGTCGAESGFIPASETAPDAFIKSAAFGIIPRVFYAKRKPMLSKPPQP